MGWWKSQHVNSLIGHILALWSWIVPAPLLTSITTHNTYYCITYDDVCFEQLTQAIPKKQLVLDYMAIYFIQMVGKVWHGIGPSLEWAIIRRMTSHLNHFNRWHKWATNCQIWRSSHLFIENISYSSMNIWKVSGLSHNPSFNLFEHFFPLHSSQ